MNAQEDHVESSIEVPEFFGLQQPTLLDDLPAQQQRKAIAWLIEQLPRVSEIKSHFQTRSTLKQLSTCSGSIGIFRWVIASCRAYLRETKLGEDVLGGRTTSVQPLGASVRQFTFDMGSPEQETNFKEEIIKAQAASERLKEYSTISAFHGGFW